MGVHRLAYRFIFLAAFAVLGGCENNPNEVNALTRKVVEREEGSDIKVIFSQTAALKAELTAPLMYRVKADTVYTEFPKSLLVKFFDEGSTLQSVVRARYGKYFDLLNKVLLRDSVVVFNMAGDTLYCNNLWWDQNQAILYTDDSVRIYTRTQRLRGTGLWAKSDFSKYTIKNPVGLVDVPKDINP